MFWLPTVFFAGWLPNTAIFALQSRSILVLACNKGQRNGPTKKKLTSSYDRRSQNEIDWNRINTLNIWRSLKYSCLRLGHKKTPVDTNLFKHPVAAPRWSPVTDEPDGRTASGKPLGKSLVQKIFKVICQTLGDNTPRSVYIYIYIMINDKLYLYIYALRYH